MTQKNKTSTYTKGMEIRRQVLGIKHVENAIKNTNKIDEKFQKFTVNNKSAESNIAGITPA